MSHEMLLKLRKEVAGPIRLGHPWIYADALEWPSVRPPRGSTVDVIDRQGAFLARGFCDPDGPIGVRVLTRDENKRFEPAWVGRKVARACALRQLATSAGRLDTDALRLIHGENDGLPGLVLDLYATTAVVRFDGAVAEAAWRPYLDQVLASCRAAGHKVDRLWARCAEGRRGGGSIVVGSPPGPVQVREGLARYEVDVVHGQKTGLFLDQRDNRAVVQKFAAGAEVLDLYAYVGAFSVAAALGGARRVTTVDLARPAIAAARRNFELNGIRPDDQELTAADVFRFLSDSRAAGRAWDLVICDPPSFAPGQRSVERALSAYRRLNQAAAAVVATGGLLATASCSTHVRAPEFAMAVAQGLAAAGRHGRILVTGGAGVDHPTSPSFPEGHYLKFLLIHLLQDAPVQRLHDHPDRT